MASTVMGAMNAGHEAEASTHTPVRQELMLPPGARVLVFSDIHIPPEADSRSTIVAEQLSATIDALVGPAAVVLAGDCFDLHRVAAADPAQMLADHPRLGRALERFTEVPERHVVVLAGRDDAAIAECDRTARPLRARGWTVGHTLDLHLATGTGPKTVRVEHGSLLTDVEPVDVEPADLEPADLDRGLDAADRRGRRRRRGRDRATRPAAPPALARRQ